MGMAVAVEMDIVVAGDHGSSLETRKPIRVGKERQKRTSPAVLPCGPQHRGAGFVPSNSSLKVYHRFATNIPFENTRFHRRKWAVHRDLPQATSFVRFRRIFTRQLCYCISKPCCHLELSLLQWGRHSGACAPRVSSDRTSQSWSPATELLPQIRLRKWET